MMRVRIKRNDPDYTGHTLHVTVGGRYLKLWLGPWFVMFGTDYDIEVPA